MCIAKGMHEIAGLQACDLRHHQEQQSIGCYIERHAEEDVGTTLVELEREPPVSYIELEERVARRQCHTVHLGHIPSADNKTTGVGTGAYHLLELRNLVNRATAVVGP